MNLQFVKTLCDKNNLGCVATQTNANEVRTQPSEQNCKFDESIFLVMKNSTFGLVKKSEILLIILLKNI